MYVRVCACVYIYVSLYIILHTHTYINTHTHTCPIMCIRVPLRILSRGARCKGGHVCTKYALGCVTRYVRRSYVALATPTAADYYNVRQEDLGEDHVQACS